MTLPPDEICYRALATRDIRFDGRLFVGVTSTGIYCRPVCPAKTPRPAHCRFFPSAAAAQDAGFRPCLRCRPEISPDAAAWRGTSNTVSRALALIAEGGLDAESGVGDLADKLGVGERQLRRLFDKHLGAPPVKVAQTRRLLFAKQLLQDSSLSMAELAAAAGFGSVRRFNDAFRKFRGAPPGSLRRGRAERSAVIRVTLGHRPPYDWDAIAAFLGARAVAGVEHVEPERYARTIAIGGRIGSVAVSPARGALTAEIRFPDTSALLGIVSRLRRLFDLDADVAAINAHLARDKALAPLVGKRPGLRLPGCWDHFELAVRALLGQQVSIAAARKFAGALTALAGPRISPAITGDDRLIVVFPSPEHVARADLAALPLTGQRKSALCTLAHAVRNKPDLLAAAEPFSALAGFGPWTAQYFALRSHADSDAFPASDAALLRSKALRQNGEPLAPKQLQARAESWRPWRAYAAQHLWTADGET
jgi:AraC family transcriptional regulator, regulatory protein of adaptative response / DNA-3-methyladenine glycosylase II